MSDQGRTSSCFIITIMFSVQEEPCGDKTSIDREFNENNYENEGNGG